MGLHALVRHAVYAARLARPGDGRQLFAILLAAALVGIGSSIFHPEASRVARLASGGRYGFAQSLFQVGGNTGTAIGPLLAAFIVMPRGQASIAWLSLGAIAASALLTFVGRWYQRHLVFRRANPQPDRGAVASPLSPAQVKASIAILLALVFSKYIYLASLTSYYTFYLIHHFNVPVTDAQLYLFIFLAPSRPELLAAAPSAIGSASRR